MASRPLTERKIAHPVVSLLEPARFRTPRSAGEQAHHAPPEVIARAFPVKIPMQLFVTHIKPEMMLGLLGPLHAGGQTAGLGYTNHGWMLSTIAMTFVKRCSWAHVLAEAALLLKLSGACLLNTEEIPAVGERWSFHSIIIPEVIDSAQNAT